MIVGVWNDRFFFLFFWVLVCMRDWMNMNGFWFKYNGYYENDYLYYVLWMLECVILWNYYVYLCGIIIVIKKNIILNEELKMKRMY